MRPVGCTKYDKVGSLGDSKNRLKPIKNIIHPGEISRIRVFQNYPHMVCTLSDTNLVYIWNMESQLNVNENKMNAVANIPNLV